MSDWNKELPTDTDPKLLRDCEGEYCVAMWYGGIWWPTGVTRPKEHHGNVRCELIEPIVWKDIQE